MCQKLLEETLKLSENLMKSSALAGGFFPSNLIGGLRSRCRVAVHLNALIWQSFCGIVLVPSLPYEKGVQSFWKDYFATASDSPVIIIPDLYSRHALTKKVSRGCLPFSLTGFILYIYFPIIM